MATSAEHALIIEDEMIIALEVEDLLRERGFRSFDVAASPEDALTYALRRRPDLITADVRIVGGTGIEAVRAITRAVGPVPHLFVTGNVEMLAGESSAPVVEKPIRHRAFVEAVAAASRAA